MTGAGGSIGSELCRQITQFKPKTIICFDISEVALYQLEQSLSKIKTKWDGTRVNVEKSTKEFVLDDPKEMFTIWENDYKKLYSYDLKETKDLDYFLLMIKQKYDSV